MSGDVFNMPHRGKATILPAAGDVGAAVHARRWLGVGAALTALDELSSESERQTAASTMAASAATASWRRLTDSGSALTTATMQTRNRCGAVCRRRQRYAILRRF